MRNCYQKPFAGRPGSSNRKKQSRQGVNKLEGGRKNTGGSTEQLRDQGSPCHTLSQVTRVNTKKGREKGKDTALTRPTLFNPSKSGTYVLRGGKVEQGAGRPKEDRMENYNWAAEVEKEVGWRCIPGRRLDTRKSEIWGKECERSGFRTNTFIPGHWKCRESREESHYGVGGRRTYKITKKESK